MIDKTDVVADPLSGEILSVMTVFPPVRRPRHPMSLGKFVCPFVGKSMTHASHKDSCDVNRIMDAYSRTGELPPSIPGRVPQFADVTALQAADLTTQITDARTAISNYQAVVRERLEKKSSETRALIEEAKAARAAKAAEAASVDSAGTASPER